MASKFPFLCRCACLVLPDGIIFEKRWGNSRFEKFEFVKSSLRIKKRSFFTEQNRLGQVLGKILKNVPIKILQHSIGNIGKIPWQIHGEVSGEVWLETYRPWVANIKKIKK